MLSRVHTHADRLFRRKCVSCGYDGELLDGGRARSCPICDCDFQSRPAMSYAEMEGLVGQPLQIDTPSMTFLMGGPQKRLALRWLAVGTGMLILLFMGIHLVTSMVEAPTSL